MSDKESRKIYTRFQNSTIEKLDKEAEERGLSRSEYIRRMTNSGRREGDIPEETLQESDGAADEYRTVVPGESLQERLLEAIGDGQNNAKEPEQVKKEVVGDIKGTIDDKIAELQADGLVVNHPSEGVYIPEE